jgi:hypothetical protein
MSEQGMSRRKWLASSAAMVAGAAAGTAILTNGQVAAAAGSDDRYEAHGLRLSQRRAAAFRRRLESAEAERDLPLPDIDVNGDEQHLHGFIGQFTKQLPHNAIGEPNIAAYLALLHALETADPAAFEQIPLGGAGRLANPQAAYAFELEGADSHHLFIRPPPGFSSAEEAGEMGELFWQALTRDVPLASYGSDATIARAVDDINRFSQFRGPKVNGRVTPDTVFRGPTPGDLVGPHVSQFLAKDIPFGPTTVPQRYLTSAPSASFLITPTTWLNAQNGGPPVAPQLDPTPRFMRNARDIAEFVHRDFTYQASLGAAQILLSFGPGALDANNPYLTTTKQGGGITFGSGVLLDLIGRVSMSALTAAFFYKWIVHRRVRPEEFGGRLHYHLVGEAQYPIHADILNSQAIDDVFTANGTYFLPQAYPEGCPPHPAYPAAHAVIAGACATILKAFFKEEFAIPNPVVAAPDGLSLQPFTGGPLTIGGELNKLASNVSIARNAGGVHWRSDGIEGMKLGEDVAISLLRDRAHNYNEPFAGYSLTKFDGKTIIVGALRHPHYKEIDGR